MTSFVLQLPALDRPQALCLYRRDMRALLMSRAPLA